MRVSNSGYNYRQNADFLVERPEGVGEYLILIIRSPARITINGQDHYTNGNCVIVYEKGSGQYFGAHNAEFINDWVQFDLNDEDLHFVNKLGIPFNTILEFADISLLSRYIELLFIERWSNYPNAEDSKTHLLRLLFFKLADFISQKTPITTKLAMSLTIIRSAIYNVPEKDWSIDFISNQLFISPSYLHYSYKKLFGESIGNDVIQSRLIRSKYLLSNTNYDISTISRMVGYENTKHFMYIFKKKTGYTPTQYRKSFSTYFVQNISSLPTKKTDSRK